MLIYAGFLIFFSRTRNQTKCLLELSFLAIKCNPLFEEPLKDVHWRRNRCLLSERNNTALATVVISVTASELFFNDFFLNHHTIVLVNNFLKLLSRVVIETALNLIRKNQLS